MRTIPVYSDYKVQFECVKVEIDRDHYIVFTPKSREEVLEDKTLIHNYVEVKIVDETVSDCLVFEATTHDLAQHVKVIQDLIRQVGNMPTEVVNEEQPSENIPYPTDDSCGLDYTNSRSNIVKRTW